MYDNLNNMKIQIEDKKDSWSNMRTLNRNQKLISPNHIEDGDAISRNSETSTNILSFMKAKSNTV